jgi:ribonuclease G
MPTIDKVGVSHRISSDAERKRLRKIVDQAGPRTPGSSSGPRPRGRRRRDPRRRRLPAQALGPDHQEERETRAPALIYADLDLVLRSVRDLLRDNVAEMIVDSEEQYARARRFAGAFMPKYVERIKLYQGRTPVFDATGHRGGASARIHRRVPLKSGGSLVIDQGEALTAIDVNTGSFVGKDDLEKTITSNNLEACDEVAASSGCATSAASSSSTSSTWRRRPTARWCGRPSRRRWPRLDPLQRHQDQRARPGRDDAASGPGIAACRCSPRSARSARGAGW